MVSFQASKICMFFSGKFTLMQVLKSFPFLDFVIVFHLVWKNQESWEVWLDGSVTFFPNRKNLYVNFSSLIFPGGKLGKIEENMKKKSSLVEKINLGARKVSWESRWIIFKSVLHGSLLWNLRSKLFTNLSFLKFFSEQHCYLCDNIWERCLSWLLRSN